MSAGKVSRVCVVETTFTASFAKRGKHGKGRTENIILERRKLDLIYFLSAQFKFLQTNEPGQLNFKVDGLQCRVFLNPSHFQSLHIKIVLNSPDNKDTLNEEDLRVR